MQQIVKTSIATSSGGLLEESVNPELFGNKYGDVNKTDPMKSSGKLKSGLSYLISLSIFHTVADFGDRDSNFIKQDGKLVSFNDIPVQNIKAVVSDRGIKISNGLALGLLSYVNTSQLNDINDIKKVVVNARQGSEEKYKKMSANLLQAFPTFSIESSLLNAEPEEYTKNTLMPVIDEVYDIPDQESVSEITKEYFWQKSTSEEYKNGYLEAQKVSVEFKNLLEGFISQKLDECYDFLNSFVEFCQYAVKTTVCHFFYEDIKNTYLGKQYKKAFEMLGAKTLEFFQVCKNKITEISQINNEFVESLANYIGIFYQKNEVKEGLYSLSTYESLVRNPKQKIGPNKRPEKEILNKTIRIPEKSPLASEEPEKNKSKFNNSKGEELMDIVLKYSDNKDYFELAVEAANEIDDPKFEKYSEDLLLKIRNIENNDIKELFMLFSDKDHLKDESGEKLILKIADQTKEEKYLEIAVNAAEELEKPDFKGFKEVAKEIEKISDPKIKAIFKNSESEKLNIEPYDPSTDPVFQPVDINGPAIEPQKPVQTKQINVGGRPKSDLMALVKSISKNKDYIEIAADAAKELDNPNFTDFSEKTRRKLSSILDKNVKNAILAKRKSTLTSKRQKEKEEELKSLKNKPAFAQKIEPKKDEIQDVTDDDEPVVSGPTPEKATPKPIAEPTAHLRARDRLRNFKIEPEPEPAAEPSVPLRARDRLRNFKI